MRVAMPLHYCSERGEVPTTQYDNIISRALEEAFLARFSSNIYRRGYYVKKNAPQQRSSYDQQCHERCTLKRVHRSWYMGVRSLAAVCLGLSRDPVLHSVNCRDPPPPPTYSPKCKHSANPLIFVTQDLQISLLQGYEGSEVRQILKL